jgi:DNA-binding NarL/FixJ family response regulator
MNTLKAKKNIKEHKVFIVDDHSILREGLSELISREKDFTVCGEAGNISDALRAIADCEPDIVIVDLALEDGSGIRLIENLVYSHTDLSILVLSMHDESIYAERCLKAGAKGYIMKHEPSGKLISALRKVLKGEVYVSEKLGTRLLNKLAANRNEISNSAFDCLSNREMEIYQLIGNGLKKQEAAEKLNLSVRTVETYIEHIKKKMNFKDIHEFVMHAVQNVMRM